MSNIKRPPEDLQETFEKHYRFLVRSALLYDNGNDEEAEPIAQTARTLLSDAGGASVLTQLGRKNQIEFLTTNECYPEENILAEYALLKPIPMVDGSFPLLDVCNTSRPFQGHELTRNAWVSFETWWGQRIFMSRYYGESRYFMTREEAIIWVANRDMGHVAPVMDKRHFEMSRHHEGVWTAGLAGAMEEPREGRGPFRATLRQIGHELIRTLERAFPELRGKTKYPAAPFVRLDKLDL